MQARQRDEAPYRYVQKQWKFNTGPSGDVRLSEVYPVRGPDDGVRFYC